MIALIALLHFGAIWSGFYDWQFGTRVIWFDNVLHALVGVAFGMCALWCIEHYGAPRTAAATAGVVVLFVLAMAAAWELAEYVFFTRFTEYAYWSRIYSPSVGEALSDIVSDLVGVGIFLAITPIKRRIVSNMTGNSR